MRETPSPRYGRLVGTHTIHGHMRIIKAFLHWCVRQDLVSPGLLNKLEMPKVEQKVIEVFTPQHITALFKACEEDELPWLVERNKSILAVLLDTSIRASELTDLTLERVHIALDEAYLVVNGKGRKQREVGLGKKSRSLLHRYIYRYRPNVQGDSHVFLSKKGHLCAQGVDKLLYRLRDRAGIEGVRCSAHTFRHTMACQYIEFGGDVMRLSRALGHTSLAVTQEYLKTFSSRQARRGGVSVFDSL